MIRKNYLRFIALALLMALSPFFAFAETLNGSNYSLENPTFDGGGNSAGSTNYSSLDSQGDESGAAVNSTNFKVNAGVIYAIAPSIPATPTLTNTGSALYGSLDFIIATGGNQTDTNYAIAISSDNFSTTNYIQTDDTVGSAAAWQTFSGWGSGTGERVTGLLANTAYKIKVKARYGEDSESGFSQTATATTSSASLTISFAGVVSGSSVAGETTTVTSGTNAIPYGSLIISTPAVAAHRITVSTNASSGYTTTLQSNGELRNQSQQIDPLTATNASPASWPSGITTGKFGYHTTDSILCTGSTNRFSANDTYAKITTTPEEVACSSSAVTNEQTSVVFKVQVGALQPTGSFSNVLTYITTAKF
jgi:hypothetical protein